MKGHWIYPQHIDIDKHFGFIYVIQNLSSGKQYIGKKQFKFLNKLPPLKGRKNKRIRYKESDWKEYTGSSNKLNKDILLMGKENFRFEILRLCSTKGSLSYWEACTMWNNNVLIATMPNGEYKYYNEQIPAVRGRWK